MVLRMAEIGVARLQPADRGFSGAVQQAHQPVAVDAVVQCLAHPDVGQRAALAQAVEPGPDMRIRAGGNNESSLLEAVDPVGRWHLDPNERFLRNLEAYLAAAQRREPGVRLGNRQQQDLRHLRPVRRVPVGVVAGQGNRLAGGDGFDPERPGARRR